MPAHDRFVLIDALFKAVWSQRLHVSEPEVVEHIAERAGLAGRRLVEQATTSEAKSRLRAQTDAAIETNVFGVPTMVVGDELFWGYDDLPHLERFLEGRDPLDPTMVPDAATAPKASATRQQAPNGRR
jgi:2-hydroxychromene-2-carboxylate isomerase